MYYLLSLPAAKGIFGAAAGGRPQPSVAIISIITTTITNTIINVILILIVLS